VRGGGVRPKSARYSMHLAAKITRFKAYSSTFRPILTSTCDPCAALCLLMRAQPVFVREHKGSRRLLPYSNGPMDCPKGWELVTEETIRCETNSIRDDATLRDSGDDLDNEIREKREKGYSTPES
jgi:hypothetical protein